MATIKDVAKEAGVSIATVSHYLNNTRYVSPELAEKVQTAIAKTGYDEKIKKKQKFGAVNSSEIALVVPSFHSTLYTKVVSELADLLEQEGYQCVTYFHKNDTAKEAGIINNLVSNKNIVGIVMVPVSREKKSFKKIIQKGIPLVFLNRRVHFDGQPVVFTDGKEGIYKGCLHLLKAGHEDISFIVKDDEFSNTQEKMEGFRLALKEYNIPFNQDLMIVIKGSDPQEYRKKIQQVWNESKPTTFLAGSNKVTIELMKVMSQLDVSIPDEVSIIGFGDGEWTDIITPPLTSLKHDIDEIGKQTAKVLVDAVQNRREMEKEIQVPMYLSINRSTQVIGKGPFGEKPVSPKDLTLSSKDIDQLTSNNFRVAISFHYGGTAWRRLHENGIRKILAQYGISIISITDAHFDPELQVAQLEGLRMQKPDVIIAIPADDELTAKQFKRISKETKLVFMSHVPEGMQRNEYSACVSVNERESGYNVAALLGNYFKNSDNVKIGFIGHGAPFYGTHLRDAVAKDVICSDFPNIEIVSEQYFYKIERTYEICKEMIQQRPDITGLYISWDQPALQAIRALKELGREDISIFTSDLGIEMATYLAKNHIVKGLSSQRPFEQGMAIGLAAVKALIDKDKDKYIAVQPYTVESKNLLKAWKDIMSEPAPSEIEEIIKHRIT
ncbi:LacI family DNA-binding transcriptional regulator [Gracilibacillus alcaliphilus]|uniref:LacI family DNA-binding transcriptional regulator n=1 Tax=Gracilibacillus alcaliphilus TaxID=1401441 RepID=UPI00195BB20D|nr:LacI family DNA-binding transcriptional regulator [Gracilibacillus alcaliphilus]MBM7679619.1 ribose transport system substrate-binding protein [Gracilibacillus alcaliphilus]